MGAPRQTVLSALEKLAPVQLAESWDNVGLIIDPSHHHEFERALLTIDLTDVVLAEALELKVDLVIAYHPPIFAPLKRLRSSEPKERVALGAVRAGITVYSPHTALDAVPGGMGDWLARAAGPGHVSPIVAHPGDPRAGVGRVTRLDRPVSLDRAVEMIKAHLGLRALRLSRADHAAPISTIAVCPGAGGAVFEKLGQVDLILSGEMRHHDVMERRARGTSVVLTDHTHSERGYLVHFAQDLVRACPGLAVSVSSRDRDPLEVL